MPCCGKRVAFNQSTRRVAISPNGNTLPVTDTSQSSAPIANNVTATCTHVYQLESTFNFGGKNYRKMKCTKCGGIKTVYLM